MAKLQGCELRDTETCLSGHLRWHLVDVVWDSEAVIIGGAECKLWREEKGFRVRLFPQLRNWGIRVLAEFDSMFCCASAGLC
jgi:hypothetical protein